MSNHLPYRGWRLDGGGWVEGFYWATPQYHWIAVWNDQTCFMDTFEVHPDSVSQATGLPDKTGKMIYGGDEVSQVNFYNGDTEQGIVKRDTDGRYYIDCGLYWPSLQDDCEIIPRDWEQQEARK